ncbi:hypothetical protein SEA_EVEPICKLES_60 [Arthrobacter phage EvePickles]|nr:hypothetical protein SEA_EVEPICKLES_60 [Arthrobacter phage EvePickles]
MLAHCHSSAPHLTQRRWTASRSQPPGWKLTCVSQPCQPRWHIHSLSLFMVSSVLRGRR